MKNKKAIALFLCVFLCFCIACNNANCTKNVKVGYVELSKNGNFSAQYKLFSGEKSLTITANGDLPLAVKVSVTSQSGSIYMSIFKTGSEPVYTGNDIPSGNFTVYINEEGVYTVLVKADNHRGGFSISVG